jgi:hypothetical protein
VTGGGRTLILLCLVGIVFHPSTFGRVEESRGAADAAPFVARGAHFEIFADDVLSGQYVAAVGDLFVQRFSRMVPPPERSARPVLVHLIPAGEGGRDAAVVSRYMSSTGHVVVTIGWTGDTRRETVERAVAQGYLTFLSGTYGGGAVHVPWWLEVAAQQLARVQAVPSHAHALAGRVVAARPMRLDAILQRPREREADPEFEAQAYWLLMFLEREGRANGAVHNLIVRQLRGEAPVPALAAAFGDRFRNEGEAHLWWLVGLNEMTRSQRTPMIGMDESRRRLVELGRFTFSVEGEAVRLLAEELWPYRGSPALRSEMARRLQALEMELGVIHPFYHNGLLSLGRLLQAALGESMENYRQALASLQYDMRTGDELVEDTRSILDDLSEELRD